MDPRAFVIGSPVEHSLSPAIHGYWLKQLGLRGRYDKRAVSVDGLADFVGSIGRDELRGCNVTVPHKVAVLDLVDHVTPIARGIGAANTLWIENDGVHATNTDVTGFMAHLGASAPSWIAGSGPAVVIGAGGAARAIVYGLKEAGVPEIRVVNRTVEKAAVLRSDFGSTISAVPFEDLSLAMPGATLLVNTSSLGMTGQPSLEPDLSPLPATSIVADIVYAPLETELLRSARLRGLIAVDGLGMLLHQAVPGFALWFGQRPTVTIELRALIVSKIECS